MKVERVCSQSVVGIRRDRSIQEAAAMMRKFHVGALVVTEDESGVKDLAGIVTDRDLVLQAVAEGYSAREVRVSEVMSPIVASVSADADLHEAIEIMRAAGVRRALVRDANGAVAGVVSLDDIIDGLATELASLTALIKSEIRREAVEYDTSRAAA